VDTRIPTYFPSDVMKLRLRFHHDANLVDVWANLEKEEEVATLAHYPLQAKRVEASVTYSLCPRHAQAQPRRAHRTQDPGWPPLSRLGRARESEP
jgi:hypothetical protein